MLSRTMIKTIHFVQSAEILNAANLAMRSACAIGLGKTAGQALAGMWIFHKLYDKQWFVGCLPKGSDDDMECRCQPNAW